MHRHVATATLTLCTLLAGATVATGANAVTVSPREGETSQASDRRVVDPQRKPTRGRAALESLEGRLPEAARRNGLSVEQLREVLLEDQTAWLDGDARLYYEEPAHTDGSSSSEPVPAPAAYPLSQTFELHSSPGSARTIYIDFDGHQVSGTAWNVTSGWRPAWDLDGDPTTFNATERETVQSVWQRVAEDYAPFDVDVTTQDPGQDAITRSDVTDEFYGTRALVTPSAATQSQLCRSTCGGIAYINVFNTPSNHSRYQPAWIFPQSLGNDAKNIAEAVSHEVGHNLGLRHDGVTGGASYYSGHGLWAPIMGAGYGKPVSQWSRGRYAGADNTEDDLEVISNGGTPTRADEAGETVSAAAAPPSGSAYITSGGDKDVYALGVCSGPLTLAARPAPVSPNLDVSLSLLRVDGTTMTTAAPKSALGSPSRDVATGMGATVAKDDVASAYYYVAVQGVGNGKPTTGYEGYASIGRYTLSVTGTCHDPAAVPSAPQDMQASAVDDGKVVSLAWAPPQSSGSSAVSHYVVTRGGVEPVTVTDSAYTFTDLDAGTSYSFAVVAVNATGKGPASVVKAPVFKPGRTRIDKASSGARGGKVTAVARWRDPSSDGGAAVTGYRVWGFRLDDRGRVVAKVRSTVLGAKARSWQPTLRRGQWKFAVRAQNTLGWGLRSVRSNKVTAR